jgi:predicted RNA-binding Zn-ribbon protein involved in translation (DUF1610 family)
MEVVTLTKHRKCVLCGDELESDYEYCPNCGGSTKELKIRKLPIRKLVAFNVIGGLILLIAMGVIGILIVLIIDLIIWYLSPKI